MLDGKALGNILEHWKKKKEKHMPNTSHARENILNIGKSKK